MILRLFIACVSVGFSYDSAKQVEKKLFAYYAHEKIDELVEYLESQEQQDNPFAYLYHGSLWLDGIFGDRKAGLANFYFLKGVELAQNDRLALARSLKAIADSLYSGDGLQESLLRALDYYLASAKLGYPPAIFNAAIVYKEQGNTKKAKYWLRRYIQHKDSELKEEAETILQKMN